MSTTTPNEKSVPRWNSNDTRHSKEDAISDLDFERLLEATYELDDAFALEARFVILVGGRLGLRRGEIAHIRESWIDWRKGMVNIPRHEPCDKGRGGGVCGDCTQRAKSKGRYNDERAETWYLEHSWMPKTEAGIRSVPFEWSPRATIVLRRFFDRWSEWQYSALAVNRRVDRAVAASELDDPVYPHALRATAADYHAGRGLSVYSLKAVMGWSDLETAQHYISDSAERASRELHIVHAT